MGQECSWPCSAHRKEQEKRLKESKYTPLYFPDEDPQEDYLDFVRKTERLHNLDKIKEIIERKSYIKPENNQPNALEKPRKYSLAESATETPATQSPFSFTEDSANGENEPHLVFTSNYVENIELFAKNLSEKHKEVE